MGWVTRVIILLVVLWLAWRFLRGLLDGLLETRREPLRTQKLERDPVCGVFVAPATALVARARGETAYFCSEKCRREWERQ